MSASHQSTFPAQVVFDCKDASQRHLLVFIIGQGITCWMEFKASIVQQAVG